MTKIIHLVTKDGEERTMAVDEKEVNDVIIWQDTRYAPHARVFTFDLALTADKHYTKLYFKECDVTYTSGDWLAPKEGSLDSEPVRQVCTHEGCNFHKVGWHSRDS